MGVSLRAGLSTKSFAREGFRLLCRKCSVSQKDTAPIPNAVYGKRKYYFQKKFQLLNPKFQYIVPHSFYFQKRSCK